MEHNKSYDEARQEFLNLACKFMKILGEGDYDEIEKLGGSHARSQIFKSITDFFKVQDKIQALEKIREEDNKAEMHLDFLSDDEEGEEPKEDAA